MRSMFGSAVQVEGKSPGLASVIGCGGMPHSVILCYAAPAFVWYLHATLCYSKVFSAFMTLGVIAQCMGLTFWSLNAWRKKSMEGLSAKTTAWEEDECHSELEFKISSDTPDTSDDETDSSANSSDDNLHLSSRCPEKPPVKMRIPKTSCSTPGGLPLRPRPYALVDPTGPFVTLFSLDLDRSWEN